MRAGALHILAPPPWPALPCSLQVASCQTSFFQSLPHAGPNALGSMRSAVLIVLLALCAQCVTSQNCCSPGTASTSCTGFPRYYQAGCCLINNAVFVGSTIYCSAPGSPPASATTACAEYAACWAIKCTPGTYGSGDGTCRPCAAGTVSGPGASGCYSCSAGYLPKSDTSGCDACAAGTFGSNGLSCSSCASGYYQPSSGQASCFSAGAGYRTISATAQQACPDGSYSTGGTSYCSNCPQGTYSNWATTGNSWCYPCPSGTWTSSSGSSSASQCTSSNCPAGNSCSNGVLTQCGQGTYSTGGQGCACSAASAGSRPFPPRAARASAVHAYRPTRPAFSRPQHAHSAQRASTPPRLAPPHPQRA